MTCNSHFPLKYVFYSESPEQRLFASTRETVCCPSWPPWMPLSPEATHPGLCTGITQSLSSGDSGGHCNPFKTNSSINRKPKSSPKECHEPGTAQGRRYRGCVTQAVCDTLWHTAWEPTSQSEWCCHPSNSFKALKNYTDGISKI